MPTKCEECKEEHYCVYITTEGTLCGDCWDKRRPDKKLKEDECMGPSGPCYRCN